jgi:triosephosphate isomerase (TIM)
MTRTIGVSLKMYFSHARTIEWCTAVADLARGSAPVASGDVELFVAPTFPSLVPAAAALAGSRVHLGAQDLATDDAGAFTGEVSGAELAEIGVGFVEVGHAERRRLYGETDEVVAQKTDAALRHGIAPILCIGEPELGDPDAAAAFAIAQFDSATRIAREASHLGRIVVAYEPVWAIGAAEPAGPEFIRAVCAPLKAHVAASGFAGSSVIYGGSAKPGMLAALGDDVDGLFMGRFAHDPAALAQLIAEAAA